MDAVTPDDVTKLIQTVDQLKVGAMVFLGFIAVLAVSAFAMWLWYRNKEQQSKVKQAQIEAGSKEAEQKAKTARGKNLTDALDRISKTLTEHEKWSAQQLADIKSSISDSASEIASATREQTDRFERTQSDTMTKVSDSFTALKDVMQEVLDRQRGFINSRDSLRIVEQTFEQIVKLEFMRICEVSIKTNDYASRSAFVHDRVTVAMTGVIDSVLKSLRSYDMVLDVNFFFPIVTSTGIVFPGKPGSENGEFMLVQEAWEALRKLHEAKIGHSAEAKALAVEQMNLTLTRLLSTTFYSGRSRALDIYGDGTSRHDRKHPSGEFPPAERNPRN